MLVRETADLFVDGIEAPFALGDLGVLNLGALAPLALRLQLLAELLEPLSADAPKVPELKIDHGVGGGQRVRQQPLQAFQLLLRPDDCAFLLLELVEQLEALTP